MLVPASWSLAIDDYLAAQRAAGYPATTQRTRQEHLNHAARRLGVDPYEVDGKQLVAWAGAQSWSPSTRRSRRTTFQSFYGWALEEGHITADPSRALRRVRQPTPAPRPCPPRVYHEALLRADEDESLWLELGFDHGMRRGEIAQVHSDDLVEDLVDWSLLVHGKGNRVRVIPLTPRMARKLLDRVAERGEGYLFHGDEGGHISARWLGKRANNLLEGHWTIHSLRHNAGTRWNRQGGLLVAQKLLGHASVATTQVYCAVATDELRQTLLATAS